MTDRDSNPEELHELRLPPALLSDFQQGADEANLDVVTFLHQIITAYKLHLEQSDPLTDLTDKGYDAWVRAQVQAALDDPTLPVAHEQVTAHFDQLKADLLQRAS